MGRSDPSSSRSAAEPAGRTAPAAGRPVLGDGAAACAGKHGRERWWWLPWRPGEETPALHAPEPRGQGHRSGARLGLDAVVRPAHLLGWLLAEARSIGGGALQCREPLPPRYCPTAAHRHAGITYSPWDSSPVWPRPLRERHDANGSKLPSNQRSGNAKE